MKSVSHRTQDVPAVQFTGKHMLLLMFAFFGVIVCVNLFMATLASRTWTGLVVKNSYVASQKFNDELAASKVQKLRGWQGQASYTPGKIQFRLVNKDGQAVFLDTAVAEIGRPAFEQQDRVLRLLSVGAGAYEAPVELGPGIWFIRVKGTHHKGPYRLDTRVQVSK